MDATVGAGTGNNASQRGKRATAVKEVQINGELPVEVLLPQWLLHHKNYKHPNSIAVITYYEMPLTRIDLQASGKEIPLKV